MLNHCGCEAGLMGLGCGASCPCAKCRVKHSGFSGLGALSTFEAVVQSNKKAYAGALLGGLGGAVLALAVSKRGALLPIAAGLVAGGALGWLISKERPPV